MSVLSTLNFWFEGYCPMLLIFAIFDLLLLFFQLYVESQPRQIKVTQCIIFPKTIVETKEERLARGHPIGQDVPYAAMGGITGFSSLMDGYMRLDDSGIGPPPLHMLEQPIGKSTGIPFLCWSSWASFQSTLASYLDALWVCHIFVCGGGMCDEPKDCQCRRLSVHSRCCTGSPYHIPGTPKLQKCTDCPCWSDQQVSTYLHSPTARHLAGNPVMKKPQETHTGTPNGKYTGSPCHRNHQAPSPGKKVNFFIALKHYFYLFNQELMITHSLELMQVWLGCHQRTGRVVPQDRWHAGLQRKKIWHILRSDTKQG